MKYSAQLTRRILHAYDLDARQSYAALARKVGPSKDIIRRTILEFEQDRTIRGYITVIDIGRLGFTGFAVYARLDTADQKKQERLLRHLQQRQEIYWLALLGGRYDILFAIQSSSLVQFSDTLSDIQRRFPFVTNAQFAIRTRATQFQRAYLNDRSAGRVQGGFEVSDQKLLLSAREKQILNLLIESPRIQVVELARIAKVSRITAQSTIARLIQNGVIQGFSALIDCRQLGLESHLVLVTLKRFDQSTRARIRRFAAAESGVIFCIESIGPWQTEFHCEVSSQQELQNLLRRFRSEFPEEIAGLEVIAGLDYYAKYRYTL